MDYINLFVYGSLKKDFYNHHLLKNAIFVCDYAINGDMYSLGMYPMLFHNPKGKQVRGEVYQVPLDTFCRIGAMELGAGYEMIKHFSQTMPYDFYVFYGRKNLKKYIKAGAEILEEWKEPPLEQFKENIRKNMREIS